MQVIVGQANLLVGNIARSVKHLTCWYWLHSQAGCNKTDDACLYSHADTGRYADQPRPAFPGGKLFFPFLSISRINMNLRSGSSR